MNLLAKYKAMHEALNKPSEITLVVNNFSNTAGKQNNTNIIIQNGPLKDLQATSAKTSPEIEGSNGVATVGIFAPPPTVEAIWSNPHKKGTPKARRESLHKVLSASFHAATIEGGGMPMGIRSCLVDLESIEKEIEAKWRKVIENNKVSV